MKLVECDERVDRMIRKGKKHGKYKRLYEEFLAMDVQSVKVENPDVNPAVFAGNFMSWCRRNGVKGIRARIYKGEAYIFKESE